MTYHDILSDWIVKNEKEEKKQSNSQDLNESWELILEKFINKPQLN